MKTTNIVLSVVIKLILVICIFPFVWYAFDAALLVSGMETAKLLLAPSANPVIDTSGCESDTTYWQKMDYYHPHNIFGPCYVVRNYHIRNGRWAQHSKYEFVYRWPSDVKYETKRDYFVKLVPLCFGTDGGYVWVDTSDSDWRGGI